MTCLVTRIVLAYSRHLPNTFPHVFYLEKTLKPTEKIYIKNVNTHHLHLASIIINIFPHLLYLCVCVYLRIYTQRCISFWLTLLK